MILNKQGEKVVKQAAALKYTPGQDSAPKIIALGKGVIAEKIVAKAKEHDVPLFADSYLAEVLNSLRIGDDVPEELYEVVANILVFVSNLDKKYGDQIRKQA